MNLDDPRLTAYAIGELAVGQSAEVEAFLAGNEEARAEVASIRQTAASVTAALALENSAGLGEDRLAELLELADSNPLRMRRDDVYHVITHPAPEPKRLRTSLLALAASITIVITTLSILVSVLYRDRIHGPRRIVAGGNGSANTSIDSAGYELASPNGLMELLQESPSSARGGNVDLILIPQRSTATTRDARSEPQGYALDVENPFQDAARNPVSSFPFQTRSDSYEVVKQEIALGHRPLRTSVRVEELVNAFNYGYAPPADDNTFATYTEVASCPWSAGHRLVRIGLRAREDSNPQAKVADDMRVSVEFNPQKVSAYRLIGFDRRLSTRGLSANSARAVLSGQSVTALYEVIPAPVQAATSPLKYQQPTAVAKTPELLTLNLHYTAMQGNMVASRVQQKAIMDDARSYVDASGEFRFAAAVASFGLILSDSPNKGASSYDQVLALADSAKGLDVEGERGSFLELVHMARTLN